MSDENETLGQKIFGTFAVVMLAIGLSAMMVGAILTAFRELAYFLGAR